MQDHHRTFFVFICAIYLMLSFAYAIVTPPWESPDEPAHYFYVSELANRWRPALDPGVQQVDNFYNDTRYMASNYEWFQPAVGYLPAAAIYRIVEAIMPNTLPRETPQLNPSFGQNPFLFRSLFQHPNFSILRVWSFLWGILAIRLGLCLLGLVVIYAAYRLGCLVGKENSYLGIVAAGWLAFLPQFTFINANIRSDSLTNAIAALVFLLAALMQVSPALRNKYALGIGILLGLGLLSKYTFLYIVPIGILAVILSAPRSPRVWLKPFVYALTPILILVGAYHLVYDEARLALAYTFTTTLQLRPDALTLRYLQEVPVPLLIDMFYARFGWANVTTPEIWSRLAFGIWGGGAFVTLVRAGHSVRKPVMAQSLKIIALLNLGMLLAFGGVVRYNLSIFSPQGRYLFPALVPYGIVGFWGFWQILPMRGRIALGIASIGFMLVFNLYALFFCLVPAYYN